jgi:hypothetical protein
MSSWGLAADWLAVAGTTLLTFGTGAQARVALTEYKILRRSILDASSDALVDATSSVVGSIMADAMLAIMGSGAGGRDLPSWLAVPAMYLKVAFLAIFYFPRNLVQIGNGNGDDAVKLAQFLRLAMVWGILMVGSALALAGAVIQLVLA